MKKKKKKKMMMMMMMKEMKMKKKKKIHKHTHTIYPHLIKDEGEDEVEHGSDAEACRQRCLITDHILELAHTQRRELGGHARLMPLEACSSRTTVTLT